MDREKTSSQWWDGFRPILLEEEIVEVDEGGGEVVEWWDKPGQRVEILHGGLHPPWLVLNTFLKVADVAGWLQLKVVGLPLWQVVTVGVVEQRVADIPSARTHTGPQ